MNPKPNRAMPWIALLCAALLVGGCAEAAPIEGGGPVLAGDGSDPLGGSAGAPAPAAPGSQGLPGTTSAGGNSGDGMPTSGLPSTTGGAGSTSEDSTTPSARAPGGAGVSPDDDDRSGDAPVPNPDTAAPLSDPIVAGGDPTAASLRAEGPYTVESYSLGFAIGPDFPGGTIWYPANAEGPFASIAIVPGFLSPRVLIEAWGPFLASHGIVTFTIDTNTPGDQPRQRSAALLNALESLAAENTRADSPLSGKLDNARQAVGGWSMGGGGTLITANGHPELKAAIAMCSWSPGTRFSSNRVPTLLFASAGDPLAGGQSQGFYTSIPDSTPKVLFEWGLGDHLMANAPTGASGQVGALGLAWLKVFLEGDERYRPFIAVECEGCTDYRASL